MFDLIKVSKSNTELLLFRFYHKTQTCRYASYAYQLCFSTHMLIIELKADS